MGTAPAPGADTVEAMSGLDPTVAFGSVADVYDRARPAYPAAAVAAIAAEFDLGPATTVVDLGAGTGKLTRQLAATGAAIVAVEPAAGMVAVLRAALPAARVLGAAAERLPLRDAVADTVVAAQAFHWFDAPVAVGEAARVLRAGGGLALTWNERDSDSWPWSAIEPVYDQYRDAAPQYSRDTWIWQDALAASPGFGPARHLRFPNIVHQSAEDVVARVLSTSFVANLPAAERDRVATRVADILSGADADRIAVPYSTDLYLAKRA